MLAARNVRIAAFPLHVGPSHHLDRADYQRLVVSPVPFALRGAPNERLVHLDGMLLPRGVSPRSDHRCPELMEHVESRLVPLNPEHFLELKRTHAWREARDEERRVEPGADGDLRPVHDGVRRQRHFVALVRAAPTSSGPSREVVGLLRVAARRAEEAVREVAGE